LTGSLDRHVLSDKMNAVLLAQARMQGADTLLVVIPVQNAHSNAKPGFGLEGGTAFGTLHECFIVSVGIFVSRVSDGHSLARQFPDPCAMKSTQFQLKHSWSEYAVEEQSALQEAVGRAVALQMDEMLDNLRLTKNSAATVNRPPNMDEKSKN